MINYIIGAIVIALVVMALRSVIKSKGCSYCDCSSCKSCADCPIKTNSEAKS